MSRKSLYLGVPKVRREVIAPLPELERYDLVHLEMSFRGGAVVLVVIECGYGSGASQTWGSP